jgi:hypothetical protein
VKGVVYHVGNVLVMTEPLSISDTHIDRFQSRARVHFVVAYIILVGILGLFAFSIFIFLFTQEIDRSKGSAEVLAELQVGRDHEKEVAAVAEPLLENMMSSLKEGQVEMGVVLTAQEVFAEAETKLRLFEAQMRLMRETGYVADVDRPRSKEELTVIAESKKDLEDAANASLAIVRHQFELGQASSSDVLRAELLGKRAALDKELYQQRASSALPAAKVKNLVANLDTIELVRTNLIRFGGAVVTLFLISLLTPIYRYNVRLGTHQARADTLLLIRETQLQNFVEMTRLFTPEYEFEKEPTTPVESIASFVKEAAGLAKKA